MVHSFIESIYKCQNRDQRPRKPWNRHKQQRNWNIFENPIFWSKNDHFFDSFLAIKHPDVQKRRKWRSYLDSPYSKTLIRNNLLTINYIGKEKTEKTSKKVQKWPKWPFLACFLVKNFFLEKWNIGAPEHSSGAPTKRFGLVVGALSPIMFFACVLNLRKP